MYSSPKHFFIFFFLRDVSHNVIAALFHTVLMVLSSSNKGEKSITKVLIWCYGPSFLKPYNRAVTITAQPHHRSNELPTVRAARYITIDCRAHLISKDGSVISRKSSSPAFR